MNLEQNKSSVYSGFSLERPPCPIHKRILAYAIDLGIVTSIIFAIFSGIILAIGIPEYLKTTLLIIGIVFLVLLVMSISSIYFVRGELKHGATFGKRMLGLSVVSIDGKKLNMRQCIYRDLMRMIDATLIVPGFLSMLFNHQNRRLGDFSAGTMVIYLERNAKENDFFYIKQDEYFYFKEVLNPLNPELKTIDNYLNFSFPHFILKKINPNMAESWEEQVRNYFQTEKANIIDQETALLFFAEHCHQLKIKFNKRNNIKNEESHSGNITT